MPPKYQVSYVNTLTILFLNADLVTLADKSGKRMTCNNESTYIAYIIYFTISSYVGLQSLLYSYSISLVSLTHNKLSRELYLNPLERRMFIAPRYE